MSGGLAILSYDPTNTTSNSNVGAYVRAGTDGDPIGSETLNALEWLRVAGPIIDSSGNEVGVTSNALDVNISSQAFVYAEDSAHTTADSGGFMLNIRVDDLTAVPASVLAGTEGDYQGFISDATGALYVAGTQFDIDDLNATDDAVQAWAHDGTGTAITSTGGALDVNIASGDVDDSLADTTTLAESRAVSTTAIAPTAAAALANRKWLCLANESGSNKSIYWGGSGVTAAAGFPLHRGMQHFLRIGPSNTFEVIGESGASAEDLRVAQMS